MSQSYALYWKRKRLSSYSLYIQVSESRNLRIYE